jgi:hypothetical protein
VIWPCHAEPVGLGGVDYGEFVAGAEQDPQGLTVAIGTRYG